MAEFYRRELRASNVSFGIENFPRKKSDWPIAQKSCSMVCLGWNLKMNRAFYEPVGVANFTCRSRLKLPDELSSMPSTQTTARPVCAHAQDERCRLFHELPLISCCWIWNRRRTEGFELLR
jgi:hypothetical protein